MDVLLPQGATARQAASKVGEEVSAEDHVDPGVAAAVETRQQHGNDEGHFWGERQAFFVSMCFYYSQQIPMDSTNKPKSDIPYLSVQ